MVVVVVVIMVTLGGTDAPVIIRQPPLSKTATGQGKWSWTADLK